MSNEMETQIRNCQAGSPGGFAWLLDEYGNRLYAYFLRSCGSPTDAEDLLQDLMVRLVERIKDYKHQGRFEPWLFRIAANMVRDRGRQLQRRGKTLSLHGSEDDASWADQYLASEDCTPDSVAEHQEMADALQQALEHLNPLDKEIVLARHYGQLSFKEIAAVFDMPLGTALAKVHRALKFLRGIMESYETSTK